MAKHLGKLFFFIVFAGICLAGAIVLHLGWKYYQTSGVVQATHVQHQHFAPTGVIGLTIGFVALFLFLTNVLYLPRKLLLAWHWLGSLRGWLAWHVASGLVGAALVALHAAFRLRSEVTTVCVYSLLIVLFTGIVGRYLIAFIPRTTYGERMTLAEIEDQVHGFIDAVRAEVIHDPRAIEMLQQIGDAVADAKGGAQLSLGQTITELRLARKRMRYLYQAAESSPSLDWHVVKTSLHETKRLHRQVVAVHLFSKIMDSWRAIHRVLAIIFVITVLIHVVWAFAMGFGVPWP